MRRRRRLAALALGAASMTGLAALAIAATLATPANAAEVPIQVHAELSPQVIGLDDTANLVVTAEGGGISSLSFQPQFVLENLERAGGSSQMEDLRVMNGALSRSFRYVLPLRPLAIGPARVRGLVVTVRGQSFHLPDQELRVQEQPAGGAPGAGGAGRGRMQGGPGGATGQLPPMPSPQDIFDQFFGGGRPSIGAPPQAEGPAAFLRAEVQPARPLLGEQAIYTIYLYTRQDVAALNATAMPTFQGFWVRDVPQPEHLVPEMVSVGSERYARVPIIRKVLFALRPGPHLLEPAACDVVIEPLTRGFFGPMMERPQELHLRTAALPVDVRPLPSPPPGFRGVIGQVSLAATLQPYKLRPGQAATLTVTLAGAGNLQGVAAPQLDLPPGLTAFAPQQRSDDRLNGTTVVGSRTWIYVLVADHPGLYSLRPQPITYFDPVHREYLLAESPRLALTALPPPPGAAARRTAPPPAATPATAAHHPPLLARWWNALRRSPLWPGILGLPALLLGLGIGWLLRWRRDRAMSQGPAAAALTEGAGTGTGMATAARGPGVRQDGTPAAPGGRASTAELEAKLKQAAREDRPRHAASLVEDGWRALLAARWGVPPTTPPPRWGAALAASGAPPELADEMLQLIEELHYLRYAPQLSTTAAVRDEVLSRSRQLLRRLR